MQKIKDGCYCLFYLLFLTLVLACRSYFSKMCFNVMFLLKRGKIKKIIIVIPLEKIWDSFSFLHIPTLLFEQYSSQTFHTLFLEDMIVKHYLYLSKIAAQMVTSTFSGNLFYQRFKFENKNFDFKTTKTLILDAWSIFFKGAHLTKLWSKKYLPWKPCRSLKIWLYF